MVKDITKLLEDRYMRSRKLNPELQALAPDAGYDISGDAISWKRFYRLARGLSFAGQHWTAEQHQRIRAQSEQDACCFWHLLGGEPARNKTDFESFVFPYQMWVVARALSFFTQKNINTTSATGNPTSNIHDDTDFLRYTIAHPPPYVTVTENPPLSDSAVTSRTMSILKAGGLGISQICLWLFAYLCCRDDALKGTQVCLIVGPNQNLATSLLSRAKQLFSRKLGLQFSSRETVMELNSVRWESFPSNHLDAMRSLSSPSAILVSESDFIENIGDVLDVTQRYITKGNSLIIYESTINKKNSLMDTIHNHPENPISQSFQCKVRLPWQVGENLIYDSTLLEYQKRTHSWRREFCLEPLGLSGNLFSEQSVSNCISDAYRLEGHNVQKSLGVDIGTGGDSPWAFTLVEAYGNTVNVLYSEEFNDKTFSEMAEHTIFLMKRYGNVRAVFVDNAIPIFGSQLRQLVGEPVAYREDEKELLKRGYTQEKIYQERRIHSVNFSTEHKKMLQNLKFFVDNEVLRINPKFDKIINGLRSAMATEFSYDKKNSPFNDTIDSLRLAMCYFVVDTPSIKPTPTTLQEAINNLS